MSTSTSQDSSLVITPRLIPSICFFVSFASMSILHFFKFIKLKRAIYLNLLIFSLLRTCLFIFRIAWSPHPGSLVLGVTSNVLLLGGFFVILEGLYILLSDWLLILIGGKTITLPNYEKNSITFLKLVSPIFSIIGATGETFAPRNIYLTSILRKTSSLGFLCLIIIYILLVAYFALKYGEVAIRKQLKALVLFTSAALLLIELVYRTFVSFSQESTPIYFYEWVFYVFECVPEVVLLLILGEVILGEWFYNVDDDNKLRIAHHAQKLAKLHSKGSLNVLSKIHQKIEKEGGSNSQADSKSISNIIVIKVNDDEKLSSTTTKNDTTADTTTTTTTNTNTSSADSPV